jgi:hypothetical protein
MVEVGILPLLADAGREPGLAHRASVTQKPHGTLKIEAVISGSTPWKTFGRIRDKK